MKQGTEQVKRRETQKAMQEGQKEQKMVLVRKSQTLEGGSRTSGSIVKPGVTSTAMGRGGLGGVDEEASVDATASLTERAQLGTILVSRRIVPEGGLNGSTRPPT